MAIIWKNNLDSRVLGRFEEALRTIPHLVINGIRKGVRVKEDRVIREVDAIIDIKVNGRPLTLLVETKRALYPRDAREAVWQLRRLQQLFHASEGQSALPVIASESISEGAKEFLQLEQISYFDEGGSLLLSEEDLYILRDKLPSQKATRIERNLFTGRRAQVVLGLLQEPETWHQVNELSQKTLASPATVSQVFVELERREWVSTRGTGPKKERRLSHPTQLLDTWAKNITEGSKPKIRRFYVPSTKSEELIKQINRVCEAHTITYAITGEWAAQIYSPFLSSISQVRVRFPNDRPASILSSELNAREVPEGSNLALIESSYGEFLFRENERGVWLANPIIAYLDLLQSDGRAKEMADHLRRERIQF